MVYTLCNAKPFRHVLRKKIFFSIFNDSTEMMFRGPTKNENNNKGAKYKKAVSELVMRFYKFLFGKEKEIALRESPG